MISVRRERPTVLCEYRRYAREQIFDRCTASAGFCKCRHDEKVAERLRGAFSRMSVVLVLAFLVLGYFMMKYGG